MTKHYGVILLPELPTSIRLALENYLFHVDEQPFLLSRSVDHVGGFVALDTLKNDNSKESRQTLIPYGYVAAIVDMTGEQRIRGFVPDYERMA
jgi:hypothetical protein